MYAWKFLEVLTPAKKMTTYQSPVLTKGIAVLEYIVEGKRGPLF